MNERRIAPRHYCPSRPRRRVFRTDFQRPLEANVTDISESGIGLTTSGRLQPGTRLMIDIYSRPHPQRRMELVRVIRSELREPGQWLAGCSFVQVLGWEASEAQGDSSAEDAPRSENAPGEDRGRDDWGRRD